MNKPLHAESPGGRPPKKPSFQCEADKDGMPPTGVNL